MPADIIDREFRHAVHIPSKSREVPDIHLIKEVLHYSDGTSEPSLRFIKNFKRPFWVTLPGCRDHKDNKEYEHVSRLKRFECTESELRFSVAKALGKPGSPERLKQLNLSPYVYGTDVSSLTFLKKAYKDMCKTETPYTVGVFDVETDTIHGTNEITLITFAFKNRVYTAVTKLYHEGIANFEAMVESKMQTYLKEYVDKRNLETKLILCDTEYDALKAIFEIIHKEKPDMLAIWNMTFDIGKVIEACDRVKIDPKYLFSDPSVPEEFKYFKFVLGKTKKVTASGLVKPINPAQQWHKVYCSSSFFVIDAMCAFRHLRLQEQERNSYSLNAILTEKLGIRKLAFTQAEKYENAGIKWHQFMQTNYKAEYVVYNRFDCISMQELEEKTKDLSAALPAYSPYSDFSNFDSQPKRIVDQLFFSAMANGNILGSVGQELKKKFDAGPADNDDVDVNAPLDDDEVEQDDGTNHLGLKGWIVTLAAWNITSDAGLCCIEEDPGLVSNIRGYVFDADGVAAYPSAITVANVSKSTTAREVIDIEGIDEDVFKLENINLLGGQTNSLEYCQTMFKFPDLPSVLEQYKKDRLLG